MQVHGYRQRYSGRARARPEAGFSLIELIVSLTIFSLLIGTLVTLIATGLQAARTNKDRAVAVHLASQEMDAIRQASFSTIKIGQSAPQNITVNTVVYAVKRKTEWVAKSATNDACDSTGSSPQVLRATVSVTWPNMHNTQPVETSTEISPPVGSYDPDNGHIAVRVRDSNASPIGGVPVRVTGSGVDTTQTTIDGSGCAFFGFLTPGTYSVTLGTTGWVDRQSIAAPTQSVTVTAATITSISFDYDQAATVALTLSGINSGLPANAVPITIANTGLLPAGTKTMTGTGITRTLADLFPFSDGYEMWSGDCADADPQGVNGSGTRFWPGASRDNAVNVDPGATTVATIAMPTLRISFERETAGAAITVVAVHAADSRCGSGSTLTLASFTATGGSQLVALPFGTWSIQAVAATPNSTWQSVVMNPNDTSTQDADVHIR